MKTIQKLFLTAATLLLVPAAFAQVRLGLGSTTHATAGVKTAGISHAVSNASRASVRTVHHTRVRTIRTVRRTTTKGRSAHVYARAGVREKTTAGTRKTSARSTTRTNAHGGKTGRNSPKGKTNTHKISVSGSTHTRAHTIVHTHGSGSGAQVKVRSGTKAAVKTH